MNSWSVEWLASYGNAAEAQFVLGPLLSRKDVKEPEAGQAITHALAWLGNESYALSADAEYVITAWLDSGRGSTSVRDTLEGWLNANKGYVEMDYICKSWLDSGGETVDHIDVLYLMWLRHPQAFGRQTTGNRFAQRAQQKVFLGRLLVLLDVALVCVKQDYWHLKRFVEWVDSWEIDAKRRIVSVLTEIQSRHPAIDLWGGVHLGLGTLHGLRGGGFDD